MYLIVIILSIAVAVSAVWRIESGNPAFPNAGRRGCISALTNTAGAPAVIWDCNLDLSEQDWSYTPSGASNSGAQPLKVFGNKCLDVKDGVNVDGTKLQLWDCVDQSPNQLWISVTDGTFQWAGTNKCVDITDSNINNGNQLQIWTCDSRNTNQVWSSDPISPPTSPSTGVRLLASGGPQHTTTFCMAAPGNLNFANVLLAACSDVTSTFPDGNLTWVIPAAGAVGPITTFSGAKCLSLRGASPSNGNFLEIWDCNGSPAQQWRFDGLESSKSISWAGSPGAKCADVKDGVFTEGNSVQVWDCDSNNRNQWWFVL
ncbi:hypothetical protein PM082_021604 [Marasmius tenuissimus]|nr:hypothetical protein PM082_021604 [Marasmius tenuissimus]